jgi:replicative DNA helicase
MSTYEQRNSARGKQRKGELKEQTPLPSNLDAEGIVCATFMAQNAYFETFLDHISAADFHDPLHRQIFTVASKLVAEGKPANSATVGSHLTELAPIPDFTMPAYLRELNKFIRGKDEIETYVMEVKLSSTRRAVLQVAARFQAMAYTGGHDLVDQLSSAVALLAGGASNAGMQPMGPFIENAFQTILTNDSAGWGPTGYRSEFTEIDIALGGWKRKNTYFLAAMEKAGKTALMLSLCRQFLLQDIPCAIFSLELKNEEIAERLIMLESEINVVNRPQGMTLTPEELEHLSRSADRVESWPLCKRPANTVALRNQDECPPCCSRPWR